MLLQPFSQTTARFAQLVTSGLLVIQATITATIIGAFAPTNLSWLAASSAIAQETPQPVPSPSSVSTSAADLKPTPIVIDCSTVTVLPIPNCRLPEPLPSNIGPEPPQVGIDPGTLLDAQQTINQSAPSKVRLEILPEPDGIKLQLRFPLP